MNIEERLALLEQKKVHSRQDDNPRYAAKQHEKGKLTARERLAVLMDDGILNERYTWMKTQSPDFGMNNKDLPCEAIITGWGEINKRKVYIFSQDFTVMGGAVGEVHGKKMYSLIDEAIKTGMPIVGLNDSGGARIQEGIGTMQGYSTVFQRTSIASGWIPQISVVLGPCAGGATYAPALTDFIIMVDPIAKMFITGPSVIRAVTSEIINFDELGGAKIHTGLTGVAHFYATSEEEALNIVKELLSFFPSNSREKPPVVVCHDPIDRMEERLRYIVPEEDKKPYDMMEFINLIVDDGYFLEIHKRFACNIIVGFARMGGKSVGIVANQPKYLAGCLDVDASFKAARFVRFCDAFNIPVITLVDCPGYLPGVRQEHMGIIRNGAKMLYAYSEATVPKITLVVKKSYGGGYSAMCGKDLGCDLMLALPTAEIAVVGPEAAADVVFKKEIESADNPKEKRREVVNNYRREVATPYRAAEWGLVHEIIDPIEIRPTLIHALQILENKTEARPYKKHCNLPL